MKQYRKTMANTIRYKIYRRGPPPEVFICKTQTLSLNSRLITYRQLRIEAMLVSNTAAMRTGPLKWVRNCTWR